MTRLLGFVGGRSWPPAARYPTVEVEEGGANANDRSNGNAEGDRLETGAMAVSPSGAYIVARRNTTTLIVDVHGQRLTELDIVGERFVFSKKREVVYAVLANLEGVVAIDLAKTTELWRSVPAFTSSAGAFLARVTDDDTTLSSGLRPRLRARPCGRRRPQRDIVGRLAPSISSSSPAIDTRVVGSTTWADEDRTRPSRSSASPTRRSPQSTSRTAPRQSQSSPTAHARSSRRRSAPRTRRRARRAGATPTRQHDRHRRERGKLSFIKNLPGFGPVSLLADGRAVAYLDTKRMESSMFDDKAQIPGPSADQYHLMMIEPRSMKFDLHPVGKQLPASLPARTASRCSSTRRWSSFATR